MMAWDVSNITQDTQHRSFGYQTAISKLNNIKHALMGRKNLVLSVKHIVDITLCPWLMAGCPALAGYQIKATFRINSQTTRIGARLGQFLDF